MRYYLINNIYLIHLFIYFFLKGNLGPLIKNIYFLIDLICTIPWIIEVCLNLIKILSLILLIEI